MPDKAKNFAHFGLGGGFWSDSGEGVAMNMMREVRGRMLATQDNAQTSTLLLRLMVAILWRHALVCG